MQYSSVPGNSHDRIRCPVCGYNPTRTLKGKKLAHKTALSHIAKYEHCPKCGNEVLLKEGARVSEVQCAAISFALDGDEFDLEDERRVGADGAAWGAWAIG